MEVAPPEWTEKPLSEVAEVIQGQSPPGNTYNTSGVGLPFFQGKAEFGELFPEARKWCTDPRKIAEQGDVLLSIRAPVGPTNLARERCCIGRGLAAIRPRPGISTKYLLHYLRSVQSELAKKATGTTFGAIGGAVLRSQLVRVAPPEEQQAIVDALDSYFSRLDEVEAGLERVQRNLKRYRASVLQAAVTGRLVPTEAELARAEGREYEPAAELLKRILAQRRQKWQESGKRGTYPEPAPPDTVNLPELPEGWSWASAEQLTDPVRVITYGVIKLGEEIADGVPTLRSSNVRSLHLELDYVKRIQPSLSAEYSRTVLQGGEVLVTVRGTLGGVAVASDQLTSFNVSREVAVVAPTRMELSHYLALSIASPLLQRWLLQRSKGIAYTGINIETLRELPLPLPPMMEANRIAAEVDRHISVNAETLSSLCAVQRRSARLRQSILKRAFEGKLVNQAPNDELVGVSLNRIRAETATAGRGMAKPVRRARRSR